MSLAPAEQPGDKAIQVCDPALEPTPKTIELAPGSPSAGVKLINLGMPRDAVLGGIARADGVVVVPKGDTELRVGDHVVVFAKSEAIDSVEKLLLA